MNYPIEVAFTSDQSTNCSVWNIETGSEITAFKGGNCEYKTLALVGDDYLIGAIIDQPKLKLWTLGKIQREESDFVCPGKISALAVTPCGNYCVGAIEKSLHVWQVPTGELIAILSHHYQPITCVKFSDDGSYFVSGGKDAVVFVWLFSLILSDSDYSDVQPRHTWTHHSSEVTDLFIGSLGHLARVATVSKDQTCKIYEMASGQLLVSICMDVELSSVTMDPAEYFLMLGGIDGNIFRINLFSSPQREIHYNEMEEKHLFKGHSEKVTCLSVSMDGSMLLSGSDDKDCRLWNVGNLTCLKTISHSASVTNAFITMSPFSLVSSKRVKPKFPICEFKRSLCTKENEPKSWLKEGLPVTLNGHKLSSFDVDPENNNFIRALSHGMKEPGSVSKEVLQSNLAECEIINQQMYAYSLNTFLSAFEQSH